MRCYMLCQTLVSQGRRLDLVDESKAGGSLVRMQMDRVGTDDTSDITFVFIFLFCFEFKYK
jgi:hypothetical protein